MRKDAREKLLGQVGLRAYSQVFAVLRSMFVLSQCLIDINLPLITPQESFLDPTPDCQEAC